MKTHSEIIKDIAVNLSVLEADVTNKLLNNNNMYQTVSSRMETLLEDEYQDYVEAFTAMDASDRAEFDAKDFWEYTEDEKRLANLEKAEAFVLLSQLALSLKQMTKGDVISDKETFGQGQLSPSQIREIISLRDHYYNQAINLIRQKADTAQGEGEVFII
jgi:hypothetical protein